MNVKRRRAGGVGVDPSSTGSANLRARVQSSVRRESTDKALAVVITFGIALACTAWLLLGILPAHPDNAGAIYAAVAGGWLFSGLVWRSM